MSVEEESAKQAGGGSPPARRSPVVAKGTKAVKVPRSSDSCPWVRDISSMGPSLPALRFLSLSIYNGELPHTTRSLDPTSGPATPFSPKRWIEVDRASRGLLQAGGPKTPSVDFVPTPFPGSFPGSFPPYPFRGHLPILPKLYAKKIDPIKGSRFHEA